MIGLGHRSPPQLGAAGIFMWWSEIIIHNPKPTSGKSIPNYQNSLSCVNLKIFLSAQNKLHLVRTEDEIQKIKYLLIVQLKNESD